MSLPSTQRVQIESSSFKKIWIYGAPFSGKTTFADQAPTPLNLNTDGNVKYVTTPRVPIVDEVSVVGRRTERKFAWEKFEETIEDLEKGSDFETIVVDLLEDTYEQCRVYMYEQLNIEHESDDAFRAWDKIRNKYLGTLKKLLNLPYNIILLSHEDTTKDVTKKTGDKITAIKPNIQDKLANKVAGMVDLVARLLVQDDDKRVLSFKTRDVEFGGGRLKGIKSTTCPLSWDALSKVYDEAISGQVATPKTAPKVVEKVEEEPTLDDAELEAEEAEITSPEPEVAEEPIQRTRRVRNVEPVEETKPTEPIKRTRRVRA